VKIFLVTSTRADFGLFKNLILEFNKFNYFDLKIITTGTHFSKKHGYSYNEIKKSNTKVFKKIFISNKAKNLQLQFPHTFQEFQLRIFMEVK